MQRRIFFSTLLVIISCLILACGTVSFDVQPGYYPPFIKAAQEGDITEIEKLLKSGELINQTTIGNQTPLHLAAAEGQDNMVRWLLYHDANPLAEDQNGKTPADFAITQGHNQTARIILDYIQLIKDEEKASSEGKLETLRELLTQDGREYTILHLAAQAGVVQLVESEIRAGADVNAQTLQGITPLDKAVISGKVEVSQLLIDAGANVNLGDIYNNTPLYYAILYENKDLVKLFLDSGADLNIRSVWGNETAFDFAKRKGNMEIIALMEQK